MPTYTAECPCGKQHDYFCRIDDRNQPRPSPCCGLVMHRVLTTVNFNKPFEAYQCPVTDKVIRSVNEHNDNLKRHGCHVLEKGELEDAKRNRARSDAAIEDKLANTAAEIVNSLPEEAKNQLATELLSSETTIVRG